MTGAIIWGVVALLVGVPFVLIWWRIADRWADEEHKRFKGSKRGDAPTMVRRGDVEHGGPGSAGEPGAGSMG